MVSDKKVFEESLKCGDEGRRRNDVDGRRDDGGLDII